jgi:hypothetical protein
VQWDGLARNKHAPERSRPMTDITPPPETTTPWQGGFSGSPSPPSPPNLEAGAIVVVQAASAEGTGVQITYMDGAFYRSFWTVGSNADPTLIEMLAPATVRQIRTQLVDQLASSATGLDDIPLKTFVEAADQYLQSRSSERFSNAVFGTITEQTTPSLFLDGAVSFPNGVVGTIQYTAGRIVAETHLSVLPAAQPSPPLSPGPAPLRVADLRSLAQALQLALSDQPGIDPAWQQVLTVTQNELQ